MKQNGKQPAPFSLRPASPQEAGLFYSEIYTEKDADLGTVGHVRMDFGYSGKEFWSSWWPHNGDQFNTPEFKSDLQTVVDALRRDGPLKDLASMRRFCGQNSGAITGDGRSFGYVLDTEHYRYCLRCTPDPGEYQGYLYCYDLRQQALAQQGRPAVGRVSFASGETLEFRDAEAYLRCIREELPDRPITGFRYETLTDDPTVRQQADDLLYDLYGEDNPRRSCNYGMTEAGKQALRDAADPSRPHAYAWFVITDINTPEEVIHRDLTLDQAMETYRDSDRHEKRLGVTKDGIATVDLIHCQDGIQQFFSDHERLDSFRADTVVAEAVEQLHQKLDSPDMGMKIGGM